MTTTREKVDAVFRELGGERHGRSACEAIALDVDDLRAQVLKLSRPQMVPGETFGPFGPAVPVVMGTWVPESDVKRMMVAAVVECSCRTQSETARSGSLGINHAANALIADINAGRFKP